MMPSVGLNGFRLVLVLLALLMLMPGAVVHADDNVSTLSEAWAGTMLTIIQPAAQ